MRLGEKRWWAALAALALAAMPSVAQAQVVAPGAPTVIDGPSPSILTLGGLSIARDGSGGLVYLKQDTGGVAHVFVSRLLGGTFQPPEEVDRSLSSPSSEPVIAAGKGGLLLIGFVNAGELYVVDRASTAAPYTAPIGLLAGAAHPAIQATNFGKAYLAFTANAGGASHDVRAAFYYNGRWSLESSPLDAVASDDAGTGSGRPQVAAAGDGVGLVVWGENGHIYSRRVWGTAPSVVYEQADVPSLGGFSEVGAADPVAGAGGDSSYVDVAFRETLSSGASQQSRVLMRRLRASEYEPVTQPDGLTTPGGEGADQPQLAVGEYGSGLVTSERETSGQVFGTILTGDGLSGGTTQVSSLPSTTAPDPVPAMAGLFSDLVTWQQNPGTDGTAEIRVRYSNDGVTLGPEMVVSSPLFGPTQAGDGLAAGGDIDGNAAVAFVQRSGSGASIVAAQLYRPAASFGLRKSFAYSRSHHPLLRWSQARERWGDVRYTVSVDGVQVGQTTATSLTVPRSLADGPHHWQVTAANRGGQQTTSRRGEVWVDTVAPAVTIKLTGGFRVGAPVHLRVSASDAPPPEPLSAASGIARITVRWGDGTIGKIRHGSSHVYLTRGRVTLIVVVRDRAGNKTTVIRHLKIRKR